MSGPGPGNAIDLEGVQLRVLYKPISQIDPTKIYEKGRLIYAYDDLNPEITISEKLGNGITAYDDLTELYNPVDHIISGLDVTIQSGNAVVQPGLWQIGGKRYMTTAAQLIQLSAQDASLDCFNVLYLDTNNNVLVATGAYSASAIVPTIPNGCLLLTTILISPTGYSQVEPSDSFVDTYSTQTIGGKKTFTLSPQVPNGTSANDAVNFSQLRGALVDTVILGLGMSISGTTLTVAPGAWRIAGLPYQTTSNTTLTIDAQDESLERFDTVYADSSNALHVISGVLSPTPIPPAIPNGTVKVGDILVTPTVITLFPTETTSYVTTTSDQSVAGQKTWTSAQTYNN